MASHQKFADAQAGAATAPGPVLLTLVVSPAHRKRAREAWLASHPGARVVEARTVADAVMALAGDNITLAVLDDALGEPLGMLVRHARRRHPWVAMLVFGRRPARASPQDAAAQRVHSWRTLDALLAGWTAGSDDAA